MLIRKIKTEDNPAIELLIKEVMTAFDCVGEGYSIQDAELENMYEAYNADRFLYYVLEDAGKILGGAGIAPLEGGAEATCELKKMYFYPEARGKGMGSKMLDMLLDAARQYGYKKCYLETVERMHKAQKLYNKYGFKKLTSQEGCTGHSGCDTFYVLDL